MSSIPNFDWEYKIQALKNGSSEDMNVDGSQANVSFKWEVPSNEIWFVDEIQIFLLDAGVMSHGSFGAISALTNGLNVIIKKNGSEFSLRSIKTNLELLMSFPFPQQAGSSGTGFINDEDYYFGSFDFKFPIRLIGSNGDLIKYIVRDNLTSIDVLKGQAILRRPI